MIDFSHLQPSTFQIQHSHQSKKMWKVDKVMQKPLISNCGEICAKRFDDPSTVTRFENISDKTTGVDCQKNSNEKIRKKILTTSARTIIAVVEKVNSVTSSKNIENQTRFLCRWVKNELLNVTQTAFFRSIPLGSFSLTDHWSRKN